MYSSQDTCSARAKKLEVTLLGLAIQAAKLDGFVSLSVCLNRNCRKGFHGRVTAILFVHSGNTNQEERVANLKKRF